MDNLQFILYLLLPIASFYIFFRSWKYSNIKIVRYKKVTLILSVGTVIGYAVFLYPRMGVDSGWFSVVFILNSSAIVSFNMLVFSIVRKIFLTPKSGISRKD